MLDFVIVAFVLTSSSLPSPRIHSRIAKCWLMNYSFIQIVELPGHIALVRLSARKITPKYDTDPEWHSSVLLYSLSPAPASRHLLWVSVLTVVSGVISGKTMFSVIHSTSNILWHGCDGQNLLWMWKLVVIFLTYLQSQFICNHSVL